jgi:hypothetical protein
MTMLNLVVRSPGSIWVRGCVGLDVVALLSLKHKPVDIHLNIRATLSYKFISDIWNVACVIFYSSIIKSRRVRLAKHVARMRAVRNAQTAYSGNLKEIHHFGDPGANGRVMLK